jgi:hypothetical protein
MAGTLSHSGETDLCSHSRTRDRFLRQREGGKGNKRNERMGIISIVTEPDEGECDMERIETKQMFHFDIEQGSLK